MTRAPTERHVMNAPAPHPQHLRQRRPWGLIAVLVAFFVATAAVIAIGVASLGLNPALQ